MTGPNRQPIESSGKITKPGGPRAGDPYAAEREKRTRERLLAEAQKLAGMSGSVGGKRGREDGDEAKRSRRKGRRGEAVSMDEVGERLRRGEVEREAQRL